MKTKKVDALWSHVHWLGVLDAEGGYTAAASRLGVSKAAVSHRMSELEQAAGVPLVRRTTRSVRLTEAGQQLVDATRESFSTIERSFAGVRDLAEEPSGALRVTAPVALGRQHVVPRIAAFLAQYPAVRIQLELSDRLSSLAQEGFDLAIRHVESVPDTHVAWALCETRSVLAASKAYLKAHGTPELPGELVDHNCLHYMRNSTEPSWSFERLKGRSERLPCDPGSFTPARGTSRAGPGWRRHRAAARLQRCRALPSASYRYFPDANRGRLRRPTPSVPLPVPRAVWDHRHFLR
jgi:DNA-binding transcriptional LysR family regulator